MPFEVFTRNFVRASAPKVTISNFGRISMNTSAAQFLSKTNSGFVVLLWDKSTNRMGIQGVKKEDNRTYNLKAYGPNGRSGAGFSAVTFLNFVRYNWTETRSYEAQWSDADQMLVITVPQEYLSGTPQGWSKREVRRKAKN